MTRLADAVPTACAVYVVTVDADARAHVAPTRAVVGSGRAADGGCVVRPERAVLHRHTPGGFRDEADGGACVADCVELALA